MIAKRIAQVLMGSTGTFYHGTSSIYLNDIRKNGLIGQDVFSEGNTVFVTASFNQAIVYAKNTASVVKGRPIIIVVKLNVEDLEENALTEEEKIYEAFSIDGGISADKILNIVDISGYSV